MRPSTLLIVVATLTLVGCDGSTEPTDGRLAVSTSTLGGDPDQDGYLLTVDDTDSLELEPAGTAEIDLPSGQHTLQLLGVAGHCRVTPATPLEVDVASGSTTPVAFEVSCPLTGIRVAVTTTGLDLDTDGYRLVMDGSDQGVMGPNHIATLHRLEPGSRTIALTGLAVNCAVTGSATRTLTIMAAEVVPVEFAVVCTAKSGVIGVAVEASGADLGSRYEALVDGARSFFVEPGSPAYLATVPAGEHVVSLVPPDNCSLETGPQSVTVSGGGLIRDTVEVTFSVTCVQRIPATLRITAPTTGPIPAQSYSVWICEPRYDCIFYRVIWRLLGTLAPNDTLTRGVDPGRYQLQLRDIPAHCRVRGFSFTNIFTLTYSDTLDFKFKVECSS